jgi:hypothetical protein
MCGIGIIRMVCVRNGAEFKCLNLCQGGTDVSVCLEIMLKNNEVAVESAIFNIVILAFPLIFMVYRTVLIEHAL